MKRLIVVVSLVLVAVIAYWLGKRTGAPPPATSAAGAATSGAVAADAAPTVWTCPMHPAVRLPEFGKCPICGMDLVALAPESGDDHPRRLRMSATGRALAEVATAPVERRYVAHEVRMVGKVDLDESRVKSITAWIAGRLERLFVDYTGVAVKKGDHMVVLYSPDLLTAQRELQQAAERARERPDDRFGQISVKAAREKLRLWGLSDAQVREIELADEPSDHVTIYSPVGGIVVHKAGFEGMYVEVGTPIYTIADLTRVWVHLDAYESDVQWLRHGQTVEFESESYPGEPFEGRIAFIQPVLDERSRSVKIRVNVPNEDGRLKPGMFVRAVVRAKLGEGGVVEEGYLAGKWVCPMHPEEVAEGPGDCSICGMPLATTESLGYAGGAASGPPLVVPVTAPLRTGKRAVVYVEVDTDDADDAEGTEGPTYEGREVVLGPRAGDVYVVREGLRQGDRVVVEGNFKIDSALQIRAKASMMSMPATEDEPPRDVRTFVAPDEFRAALGSAIELYVEASERLAADDATGARLSLVALGAALDDVPMSTLDAEAHLAWMKDAKTLAAAVQQATRSAGDIERQRRGFLALSEALPGLLRRWNPTLSEPLRRFHCPMAFDDRGADWFAQEERIANPYFGAAMLRCGEETDVFTTDLRSDGER